MRDSNGNSFYYLQPSSGDVARIVSLWRETPNDLNGVRMRFLGKGSRRMGLKMIIRLRPLDLIWPSPKQRERMEWPKQFRIMDGPDPTWPDENARMMKPRQRSPTVVDAADPSAKPETRTAQEIQDELMNPSKTDPTPEQIRQLALEMKTVAFKKMATTSCRKRKSNVL